MKKYLLFFVSLLLLVSSVAAADGDVIISPSAPDADDDLTVYVSGYEETTFDFYWLKGGYTYFSDTGASSTLDASYTEAGDEWTVSVWVPASAWFDTYEYGEASVTIEEVDEGTDISIDRNTAPVAQDISFTVTEGDFVDVDLVRYVGISNYNSAETTETQDVPAYDADGDRLTISYSALLDANGQWQTEEGDAGTYTLLGTVSDGIENTDVTISITVEGAEITEANTVPSVVDIHFTVTEGDFVDVDLVEYTDFGAYFVAALRAYVFETQDVPAYDRDGDSLTITYGSLLDVNGQWQTEISDEGSYEVIGTVSDGIDSTDVTISITVLCLDSDGDGVCDSDEGVNTAPLAEDISFTVTEGDFVDVDLVQYRDISDYSSADTSETQDVPAYDADGDSLTISYDSLLDADGEWQTEVGDEGRYLVTGTISDGRESISVAIAIDVRCLDSDSDGVCDSDEEENTAPEAADIFFSVTEGDFVDVDLVQYSSLTAYRFAKAVASQIETENVPAYDADGDRLTISYSALLDANGQWQTEVSDEGSYEVIGTVSDGIDSTDVTISITVVCLDSDGDGVCDSDEGVNTAPLAQDISFTVTEGDLVDVDLVEYTSLSEYIAADTIETQDVPAYDGDGDSLSISYSSLLDVNGQWQTELGDAGNYFVTATVSDGIDSVTVDIDIRVECLDSDGDGICDSDECPDSDHDGICDEDENAVPKVADIFFSVTEGDLVDVDLVQYTTLPRYIFAKAVAAEMETQDVPAYDRDGDSLTISYDSLLDVNGQWQTELGDKGSYEVIGTVSDGIASRSVTISITVLCLDSDGDGVCDSDEETCPDLNGNGICDEDENAAPVLDAIADLEVDEGETVSVCASAIDADGDPLSYTFGNIPAGSVSAACWTWQTNYNDAGLYEVTVTVSDGMDTDSTSFTVKVNDLCDDLNLDGICDEEEVRRSDYEGDLLVVEETRVLNANELSSAYDVSDLNVETSGVFYVEDETLYTSGSDDTIKVLLTLSNHNSFDAREISVTFLFDGETYTYAFEDLDRAEQGSQIYAVAIPENLETGEYPLILRVESDDLSYETAFNLYVISLGDYITEENPGVVEPELSFWERVEAFFTSLF